MDTTKQKQHTELTAKVHGSSSHAIMRAHVFGRCRQDAICKRLRRFLFLTRVWGVSFVFCPKCSPAALWQAEQSLPGRGAAREVSNPLNQQQNSNVPWGALQPPSNLIQAYLACKMWLNQHCRAVVPHTDHPPAAYIMHYFCVTQRPRGLHFSLSEVIANGHFKPMNIHFLLLHLTSLQALQGLLFVTTRLVGWLRMMRTGFL